MRFRHLVVACGLAAALGAPGALAQQLPPFTSGDTLRIHAPGAALKRTRVTFVAWRDSTLRLRAARGDTLDVPFPQVVRIDRHAGKDRLRGALRGAGVLGTVGMLVGLGIGQSEVAGCQEFLCEMEVFNYMAVGMLAGAAVGIPFGATAFAPDRWRRVALPERRGFPAYRQPFHETVAFQVAWFAGSLLLAVALN